MKTQVALVLSAFVLVTSACSVRQDDASVEEESALTASKTLLKGMEGQYVALTGGSYRFLTLQTAQGKSSVDGYSTVDLAGKAEQGTLSARKLNDPSFSKDAIELTLTPEGGQSRKVFVFAKAPYVAGAIDWSEGPQTTFKKLTTGECATGECTEGFVCSEVTPIYAPMHTCVEGGLTIVKK